jgi:hypothetical protein
MTHSNQPLRLQIPSQGWKQFLTSRKEILDAYDKARIQSSAHKVQTYHGNVAEAEFRKWLSNFLPKKYGVTSGYVISQGNSHITKASHFDVIIYEQLEAPILWIENNPDSSDQGKSLAIPAEYIKAIIEVKSAFKNSTVKSVIEHLAELTPLLQQIDPPEEKYKLHLPKDFFCLSFFFELRREDINDKQALNSLVQGINIRGYIGGLILRGNDIPNESSGKLEIMTSKNDPGNLNASEGNLLSGLRFSESIKLNEELFGCSLLSFTETRFSEFSFDVIALLNGTYESGRLSSFHALGSSIYPPQ